MGRSLSGLVRFKTQGFCFSTRQQPESKKPISLAFYARIAPLSGSSSTTHLERQLGLWALVVSVQIGDLLRDTCAQRFQLSASPQINATAAIDKPADAA